MRLAFIAIGCLCLLTVPHVASATPITIGFDSLSELDAVTTQFAGLTFSNATVLSAGSSLNELEFPPHSGTNAVFDDGGPMSIAFATPVSSFSAFVTYGTPLTLVALDPSGHLLGSASSLFASNLALSGDPGSSANELLQIIFATPISSVLISGDPAGGSFVLDDVTFDTAPADAAPVPEPATLVLMTTGLAVTVLLRRGGKQSAAVDI